MLIGPTKRKHFIHTYNKTFIFFDYYAIIVKVRGYIYKLNFRKWFKYGLKAQKLLAQGIALGIIAISKAPCKGKSFMYCLEF